MMFMRVFRSSLLFVQHVFRTLGVQLLEVCEDSQHVMLRCNILSPEMSGRCIKKFGRQDPRSVGNKAHGTVACLENFQEIHTSNFRLAHIPSAEGNETLTGSSGGVKMMKHVWA
jgi:hypothetical protein